MVISIVFENSAQMVFAKHDDVVEALATDRADEALRHQEIIGEPVLGGLHHVYHLAA